MPNWIAITTDTLNEASVAALISATATAALGADQESRAPGIIQGVVSEVRNAVATCKSNRVDADPTRIPASQRDLTVDLIIARLKGAVDIELTQDERDNLAWRRAQLKAIAACELVVDQPDAPVAPGVQGGAAVQLVRPPGANPFGRMGTS